MNEIDGPRPTPAARPSRLATGLAAAVVALSVLFVAMLAAPPSGAPADATPEGSPETFTALGPVVASSPSTSAPTAPATSPSTSTVLATPLASPSPVVDPDHVATRVRVPDLHIDLAVVAPPRNRSAYPKCGVAMYLANLEQPGDVGATYLYAHARKGMFLPIYERAIQKRHGGPKSMIGLSVEVYTSDDLRYTYTVEEVRVHQTSLGDAAHAKTPEVWLQTSEGPKGTRGKTQLRAVLVDIKSVSRRQAHPVAKPVTCG